MDIWDRMRERDAEGRAANVAVVGAGFIGKGLVYQLARSPGMRPALVVNRGVERAIEAYAKAGIEPRSLVVSDDPTELTAAIADGRAAVSSAAEVLAEIPGLDVCIEATGAMDHGAAVITSSLEAGLDVISMNAEVDATIGHLLHRSAAQNGALYTVADGDQPGVLMRQIDFVQGMGFELVAALNCKRNLNLYQNPTDSRPYAERDNTSVLMTTAFGDGTKMQIENAVVANLTGLIPDRRGMHGPETTLSGVLEDLVPLLSRHGVVDYTLGGDFAGGVCVIGYADDPDMVAPYMRYSKMGDGPYYLFFRPYHLLHLEVPLTVAEAVEGRGGLGTPTKERVAEVVAMAKKDLQPGERLDGIGGYACYGYIDTSEGAAGYLPVGLSHHARLETAISRDEPISLDSVELDEDAFIVQMYRRQQLVPTATT